LRSHVRPEVTIAREQRDAVLFRMESAVNCLHPKQQ